VLFLDTAVNVSPGVYGQWVDVDLSQWVPTGAPGVILHVENTSAVLPQYFGARPNGSSTSILPQLYLDRHQWTAAGIDLNRMIELYLGASNVVVYLVGYFHYYDGAFFINPVVWTDRPNSWSDLDVSAYVEYDSLAAVFGLYVGTDKDNLGVRPNGCSDPWAQVTLKGATEIIALDANRIVETYDQGGAEASNKIALLGYLTTGLTAYTNGTAKTPTAGVWTDDDLSALSPAARGGIYRVVRSAGSAVYNARKKGASNFTSRGAMERNEIIVECDASKIVELYRGDANITFYLVGYFWSVLIYVQTDELQIASIDESVVLIAYDATVEMPVALLDESIWAGPHYVPDVPLEIAMLDESDARRGLACEWTLVNKLQMWIEWTLKNALRMTREWTIRNQLKTRISIEWLLKNRMPERLEIEWALVNALLGAGISIEWMLRNALLSAPLSFLHTWDVLLGGASIKEMVLPPVAIDMDRASFTNTVSLSLRGLEALAAIQPHIHSGQDALWVEIEGSTWRFMVEEVDKTLDLSGPAISVTGRSKTALLADRLYAAFSPITKIWEADVLASDICLELASGFTLQFDLPDWVVPGGALSAEEEMPIEVMARLAGAVGGIVRSGPAGELFVERYFRTDPRDMETANPAAILTEADEVFSVTDAPVESEGYNEILVEGKGGDEAGLVIELDAERNGERTEFLPGQDAYVRVYPTPLDVMYTHQVTLGTAEKLGTFEREISGDGAEEIPVADGRGSTRYPILEVLSCAWDGRDLGAPAFEVGGMEIRFTVEEGCSGSGMLRLSYRTQYDLWRVTSPVAGDVICCLEDAV
jgi:hypothetical protein